MKIKSSDNSKRSRPCWNMPGFLPSLLSVSKDPNSTRDTSIFLMDYDIYVIRKNWFVSAGNCQPGKLIPSIPFALSFLFLVYLSESQILLNQFESMDRISFSLEKILPIDRNSRPTGNNTMTECSSDQRCVYPIKKFKVFFEHGAGFRLIVFFTPTLNPIRHQANSSKFLPFSKYIAIVELLVELRQKYIDNNASDLKELWSKGASTYMHWQLRLLYSALKISFQIASCRQPSQLDFCQSETSLDNCFSLCNVHGLIY